MKPISIHFRLANGTTLYGQYCDPRAGGFWSGRVENGPVGFDLEHGSLFIRLADGVTAHIDLVRLIED